MTVDSAAAEAAAGVEVEVEPELALPEGVELEQFEL
jgi:hypothetical protein